MQIKLVVIHRCLIDLEIARMNHHAHRRPDRQRHAINRAVRHRNKFHFKRPDLHQPSRHRFKQLRRIQQPRLRQPLLHQRQREPRPINGHIQVAQNVRQRPDVILMPVRQHNRPHVLPVLFQISDVRNHQVHAQQFGLREHHSRVHHQNIVAEPECHHVHSEFAKPPKGNNCQ